MPLTVSYRKTYHFHTCLLTSCFTMVPYCTKKIRTSSAKRALFSGTANRAQQSLYSTTQCSAPSSSPSSLSQDPSIPLSQAQAPKVSTLFAYYREKKISITSYHVSPVNTSHPESRGCFKYSGLAYLEAKGKEEGVVTLPSGLMYREIRAGNRAF